MNKLISIGYLGIQSCYLNIDKEEAIKRYCEDNNINILDFDESGVRCLEFEFKNEFECYDIWKKL